MVKFKTTLSNSGSVAAGNQRTFQTWVWNDLSSANFPISGFSRPEGFDLWITLYQHYEVYGVKIRWTTENQGIFTAGNTVMSAQPTACPTMYVGISAEGHGDATNNPLDAAGYWVENVLRQQRWSKVKNVGTRDSGSGIKTLTAYYSTKQWTTNMTEKNINYGTITYVGSTPGVGTPTAPAQLYKFGYVYGYSSAVPVPVGSTGTTLQDWTVTYYVRFWNKRPNYSLGT